MRVILGMVQTVNGMIARTNFKEDFLSWDNWKIWKKLAKQIGCFVVGRKTYELVRAWEGENFRSVDALRIVISKNKHLKLDPGFLLANSPRDALRIASERGVKQILISGGSKINSSFMKENLIDEITLLIGPYVLGKGINIFEEGEFEKDLKLVKVKRLEKGIVLLNYKIIKK